MPATTLQSVQDRWGEILQDPALRDLPYKVETNARGQILLSPHTNRHSFLQKAVAKALDAQLPGGEAVVEFAIATDGGVKVADVIWTSAERRAAMQATGDPTTRAPEICVDVMSRTNTEAEMQDKRALYRAAGADEVWIVSEDGAVRFFDDEQLDRSRRAPSFPTQVDA